MIISTSPSVFYQMPKLDRLVLSHNLLTKFDYNENDTENLNDSAAYDADDVQNRTESNLRELELDSNQ